MKPPSMALPPSPSQDLELAREFLVRKDFDHAALHASAALVSNPQWPEGLALFDAIVAAAPKKEKLLKPAEGAYFGHVAGYARVLHILGRDSEAVETLLNVIRTAPERGYEKWAADWLRKGGVPIDPRRTYSLFPAIIEETVARIRLRPSEKEYFTRFIPLVTALLAAPGCGTDAFVRIIASGICRRAGMTQEALGTLAFTAPRELETQRLAMVGLALRAKGDCAGAESAFRAAYDASGDPTQIVECARARWEAGDLKGAEELLEWARPRIGGPDDEVDGMLRYLHGRVDGEASAAPLVSALGTDASPDDFALLGWFQVGSLEAPPDATVNLLQKAKAQGLTLTPDDFRLKVSCIEAPSVRLSAALVLTGTPNPKVVRYDFASVPRPDPRLSRGQVRHRAWAYDDGMPRQGCAPPSEGIQGAVRALAGEPYFLPRWWRRAATLAKTLGPESAAELVAAMVWPSPPPDPFTAWDWVRHVQFAAAVVLAQLDAGWRGGEGRQALLDILSGPIDWVVDAAVVALVERALDDPAAIDEIASVLEGLTSRIPDRGTWSLRGSLPLAYLRLPGRPVEERARFRGMAREYFGIKDTGKP